MNYDQDNSTFVSGWDQSLDETKRRMKSTLSVFNQRHTRQLLRGRTKRLGLLETLHMRCAGRSDGKIGIPKQTDDGTWTSVIICKEITAYEEYCDKIWGDLQISLHWGHSRSDVLVDELLRLDEKIGAALKENIANEVLPPDFRKYGEEILSDSQVTARRKREAGRAKAQQLERITKMQKAYEEKFEELSLIHGFIVESSNAARHICERVMNHTKQRIDVYWRAAFRVHPANKAMPVIIEPLRQSCAESTYIANHEGHDSAVAALLAQCERRIKSIKSQEQIQEVA